MNPSVDLPLHDPAQRAGARRRLFDALLFLGTARDTAARFGSLASDRSRAYCGPCPTASLEARVGVTRLASP
jgi:hypothetical protein